LEIRLTNILNNQKALKKRLKELARFEGFDIPVTNHEQAFVEKLLSIIQNNMENSGLDVQFIADELNISRSKLHSRMKTLMNMSTSEFINTVRINKAKKLIMQEEEITFSEIAYKVGYNDSAYFTRIFKKHSGKTPKEYKAGIKSREYPQL
jgi:YesN/AraC family two-component response regulator